MREVQTECPQCGAHDAYLQPEEGDCTDPASTWIIEKEWVCSHCGYPDTIWTKCGSYTINRNTQWTVNVTVTDGKGKEIKLPLEKMKALEDLTNICYGRFTDWTP